jgi:hypothetical protein
MQESFQADGSAETLRKFEHTREKLAQWSPTSRKRQTQASRGSDSFSTPAERDGADLHETKRLQSTANDTTASVRNSPFDDALSLGRALFGFHFAKNLDGFESPSLDASSRIVPRKQYYTTAPRSWLNANGKRWNFVPALARAAVGMAW